MRSVTVVLFGPVRDVVGTSELTVDVPEPYSGNEAFEALAGLYPGLRAWRPIIRLAVNREYVSFDRTVQGGDEIGLIPPVSGG